MALNIDVWASAFKTKDYTGGTSNKITVTGKTITVNSTIYSDDAITKGSYKLTFPSKAGTFALTSDIPTITAAERTAMGSGITSDLVKQITTNKTDISNLQTSVKAGVTFKGKLTSLPAVTSYTNGDLIIVGTKEYILLDSSGTKSWVELGDEGTHLTKTTADGYYVAKNGSITGATKCKITYDSKGLVTKGENLTVSDIPDLPTSKITSGTFPDARIEHAATWNAKQNALSTTQLAAANSGITSAKVKAYDDYINKTRPTVAYITATSPSTGDRNFSFTFAVLLDSKVDATNVSGTFQKLYDNILKEFTVDNKYVNVPASGFFIDSNILYRMDRIEIDGTDESSNMLIITGTTTDGSYSTQKIAGTIAADFEITLVSL